MLASPPREVHLPAPSQAGWVLELRSADGRQIPFTGQTVDQGSVVSASPPYLAAGTYLLGWGTGSGFSAVVSFSVGAPSASVTVQPSAIDRPAGLVAAVCLMVAAACAGMWAIAGRRRLVFRTAGSLLAFLGGLCAWASQAAPGVWVTAGAAVLLGFSVWLPRSGMRLTLAVASVPGALAISPPEAPGGPGGVLAITFGILGAGLAVMFAGMLARRLAASGASESAPPADREPDLSVLAAHEGMWIRLLVALLFTVLVPFWMMFGSGVSGGFVTAAAVLSVLLFAGLAIPTLVVAAARTATGRAAGIWLERTAIAAVLALLVGIAGVGVADTTEIELLAGDVPPPASCLVDKNRLETHRCLETVYTAVVNSEGVTSALENLQQLVAGQPRARFFCHDASHAIGRTALETSGSVSEAFQSGFDVCDFGFYHGIVEGAAAHLDDDAFRAAVPNLCVELEPLGRLFVYQCTHGLGHAAARRTNNDMVRALGFCEALDTMPGIRPEELDGVLNGCGTGVTMEWFAVATSAGIDAVAPAVGEVREVCDAVPDRWLPECLEYVGNTLDTSNPVESLKELAGWCATTRDRGSCMIGLARAAGGVGVDPRSVFAVCDLGGETRDTCVRYFIAGVATTVEYRVEAVDELCALLPESDRDGPGSLCAGVRSSVEDILSAGDGRPDAQPGGSQRSP